MGAVDKKPNFSNVDELLAHAVKSGFYEDLLNQLKKDFSLANIAMDWGPANKSNLIASLVKEKIYVLLLENFPDYLNLLYVVDVPEAVFKQLTVTDAVDVAEQVTFLVLLREFDKVWFKRHFG